MIKIEGKIQKLKVEDSKIHPLKDLDKQAVGVATLGTLTASSSLMGSAPIVMMAARGIKAETFKAEVNGVPVIGQFTSLKFNENMQLVLIMSEEKIDGRHLVYTALEPKNGILHMIYEMGRSVKRGYRDLLITSLIFSLLISFIVSIIYIIYCSGK